MAIEEKKDWKERKEKHTFLIGGFCIEPAAKAVYHVKTLGPVNRENC